MHNTSLSFRFLNLLSLKSLSPGYRVIVPFVFGLCPQWVRLVQWLMKASCWEGLVPVFWWKEASLCPSDGQSCVRGWLVIEFVFLHCLLFGQGILRRALPAIGVVPGLRYRWTSLWEFSLINIPWGQYFFRSLVSWTQGFHPRVSSPSLKSLVREWRCNKPSVMAIKGIKTNKKLINKQNNKKQKTNPR